MRGKPPALAVGRFTVFNINEEMDPNIIVMSSSLRQYSLFVHQVNEELSRGQELGEAIRDAIMFCVQNDIMKEFLQEHGSEVSNMLYDEWNMDHALRVHREEGRKEGRIEGREEGREEGARTEFLTTVANAHRAGISAEQIAKITGHTQEEVEAAIAETDNN